MATFTKVEQVLFQAGLLPAIAGRGYDPSEARDNRGRWTTGGDSEDDPHEGAGIIKPLRPPQNNTLPKLSELVPAVRNWRNDKTATHDSGKQALTVIDPKLNPRISDEDKNSSADTGGQKRFPFAKDYQKPVPTTDEIEKNLQTSPVVGSEELGHTASAPHLITLQNGMKAIFKSDDDEPCGYRAGIGCGQQAAREIGAYKISQIVGDNLVPPTVTKTSVDAAGGGHVSGVAQAFVEDAQSAGHLGQESPDSEYDDDADIPDALKSTIQKVAAFDYVIGNQDRNPGNWLVGKDGKITLVDHGLSFAHSGYISSPFLDVATRNHYEIPEKIRNAYANNKGKILSTLSSVGLPQEDVDRVGVRIDNLAAAKVWPRRGDRGYTNMIRAASPVVKSGRLQVYWLGKKIGTLTMVNGRVHAAGVDRKIKNLMNAPAYGRDGKRISPLNRVKWFAALPETYCGGYLRVERAGSALRAEAYEVEPYQDEFPDPGKQGREASRLSAVNKDFADRETELQRDFGEFEGTKPHPFVGKKNSKGEGIGNCKKCNKSFKNKLHWRIEAGGPGSGRHPGSGAFRSDLKVIGLKRPKEAEDWRDQRPADREKQVLMADEKYIDPRSLVTSQPEVTHKGVGYFVDNPGELNKARPNAGLGTRYPLVLDTKDGKFLYDGNHRAQAAIELGKKLLVHYIDVRKGSSIKAGGPGSGRHADILDKAQKEIADKKSWTAKEAQGFYNRYTRALAKAGMPYYPDAHEVVKALQNKLRIVASKIHVGGPGSGRHPGFGHGTVVLNDKQKRGIMSYVPASAELQQRADRAEKRLAKGLGAVRTNNNSPYDVLMESNGKTHAIELKTFQVQKNDKVTMHPESLRRKQAWASNNGASPHTVVIDMRGSKQNPTYYHRTGIGSFRLSGMKQHDDLDSVRRAIIAGRN